MNQLYELITYIDGLKTGVDQMDKAGISMWYEGFMFAVTHIEEKGKEILVRDKATFKVNNEGVHIIGDGVTYL